MKALVILSGNGVYDGAEIHESVLTLLALKQNEFEYDIAAPNISQHHVINHLDGSEMNETRNVLQEAARIARGKIIPLDKIKIENYDALTMPGGFGAAKNLTKWAFSGPEGDILEEIQKTITEFWKNKKPIFAMCMSPVVVAKALEKEKVNVQLTVGHMQGDSPYDLTAINAGIESIGSSPENKYANEISIDEKNKIVTSPCYMMNASIDHIYEGIRHGIDQLKKWL